MNYDESIIVGLDIGTTKVCAIIGMVNEYGSIDVLGVGVSPSKGLRKGVVVNIESTVHSVATAIEKAELMAGIEVKSVYAGIAGGHIEGINSRGVVAVSSKNREISREDVERVIDAAKAIAIPMEREVIHVFPQEFIVDNQDGIKDPIGMSGVRLEAEVHIVTGAVASAQNIVKSVNRAGYAVNDIVLEPLASALSTLKDDEKELGVVLLDIGGGTTDVLVYLNGSIWHTSVIALGGNHITNDISIGLRTPVQTAEEIKKKWGVAVSDLVDPEEAIEVPSVGGRKPNVMPRQILAEIIQPRIEEIFFLVKENLDRLDFKDIISGGIVLTGGTSRLVGVERVAEKVFEMPVRVGRPQGVGGLVDEVASPEFATGVGLLLYGMNARPESFMENRGPGLFSNIKKRMVDWLGEFF
ncbi:cell division protein FtsA [Candidatus Aerophobetes bacterium]|uniref:Cell division protein FtsA n=1 Tax=Aerophobetes bacterium TaxID=2030807 RepID=A0A662DDF1_UNCAE|nr:MAG: cell division protein FtsA [Candidatus Aerophobetes bacterium]